MLYEGDITIANICEGLSYIVAGKAAGRPVDVMKKISVSYEFVMCIWESESIHLSILKDFSRSQAVTYTAKVVSNSALSREILVGYS